MHLTRVVLLLCITLVSAVYGNQDDNLRSTLHDLRNEVLVLRQQLAQLQGAALVATEGRLTVNQPFLPSSSNTGRTIASKSSLWPHHYTFLSAVAADHRVTCSHLMVDRHSGDAKYMVVGDARGWLYFFTVAGQLLYEHDLGPDTAITALASQQVRSNASQLAVGLQDGTLTVLVLEHDTVRAPNGHGITGVKPIMTSKPDERLQQQGNSLVPAQSHMQPIRHMLFTKSQQRRLLLAVDGSGLLVLMVPHSGRAVLQQELGGPPLALNLNTDHHLVVQSSHAAVVALMHRGRSRITRPCTGLSQPIASAGSYSNGFTTDPGISGNHTAADRSLSSNSSHGNQQSGGSAMDAADVLAQLGNVLVAAAFDPSRPYRVFGVSAGGELLTLLVPSARRPSHCRVIQRMPLGLPQGPVRLLASKGRLLLLHAVGMAAFNISTGSQPLQLSSSSSFVSHTWSDLWRLYGLQQQYQQLLQQSGQQQLIGQQYVLPPEVQAEPGASQQQQHETHAGSAFNQFGSEQAIVLHTAADDDSMLPTAATNHLMLLPFGSRGVSAFAATAGYSVGSLSGGSRAGFDAGQSTFDWMKLLQPFIVVLMVVVGMWQFMRASRRSARKQHLRALGSSKYGPGSGLEGLDPKELGQLGRPDRLFGGSMGFMEGLDQEFGPYAGPRGNRDSLLYDQLDRDGYSPSYGGLNTLTARRRARAVMQGRADRQIAGGLRKPIRTQQQQQQQGGLSGSGMGSNRSSLRTGGPTSSTIAPARRVTFDLPDSETASAASRNASEDDDSLVALQASPVSSLSGMSDSWVAAGLSDYDGADVDVNCPAAAVPDAAEAAAALSAAAAAAGVELQPGDTAGKSAANLAVCSGEQQAETDVHNSGPAAAATAGAAEWASASPPAALLVAAAAADIEVQPGDAVKSTAGMKQWLGSGCAGDPAAAAAGGTEEQLGDKVNVTIDARSASSV